MSEKEPNHIFVRGRVEARMWKFSGTTKDGRPYSGWDFKFQQWYEDPRDNRMKSTSRFNFYKDGVDFLRAYREVRRIVRLDARRNAAANVTSSFGRK